MTVNMTGAFDGPICGGFMFEAAFVTNEFFHFSILVFARGNPRHIITNHPQHGISTALGAISMRIQGLGIPHTAFETEGFIG
jgi:hypothetical protein